MRAATGRGWLGAGARGGGGRTGGAPCRGRSTRPVYRRAARRDARDGLRGVAVAAAAFLAAAVSGCGAERAVLGRRHGGERCGRAVQLHRGGAAGAAAGARGWGGCGGGGWGGGARARWVGGGGGGRHARRGPRRPGPRG